MNKTIGCAAVFFGLLAVVFGAFGAHILKEYLTNENLQIFETGVRYQMYHSLLLLCLATTSIVETARKNWIFYLISGGILCFSFSLYLIATVSLTGLDSSLFGPITPLGGILLIAGWALLGYRFFRYLN